MGRWGISAPAQIAAGPWWTIPAIGAALGVVVGYLLSGVLNRVLGWSFWAFNVAFDFSTAVYTRIVGLSLRVSLIVLLLYGGLVYATYWSFTQTPTGFIPMQDKGYLLVNVQLPDSASVQRTQEVMREISELALRTKGVKNTVAIAGQSILLNANAPNFGALYLMLEDFQDRPGAGLHGRSDRRSPAKRGAEANPRRDGQRIRRSAGRGLGNRGRLQDRDRRSRRQRPQSAAERPPIRSSTPAGKRAACKGCSPAFARILPGYSSISIARRPRRWALSMGDVFNTLQVYLASLYVNDFNQFGRTWQVNLQAAAKFRTQIDDIKQLKIRNASGGMTPLSALVHVREVNGPVMIVRYNMYPAAPINANAAPGVSSGQAIASAEQAASRTLDRSMRSEWTELALLQLQTGNTAMIVFVLAVVLVFLVLAAQYESWSLPLAVILVVPMCLLCSCVGVMIAHMDINIFTQIGFVVLVGLACKNAILIVEFAKKERESGVPRFQATINACKLRLRPIMMTSFAFILGVVPLVVSQGAGAEMRRTLGTAVFAGMLGVTLFGIFLTPVFFYVIQWASDMRHKWKGRRQLGAETTAPMHVD